MTTRRIARELAVIVLPQLAKGSAKLQKPDLDRVLNIAVNMLCEHARRCLEEADTERLRMQSQLADIEVEHPDNAANVSELTPVQVSTGELRQQLESLTRAIHLVSEALDVPQLLDRGHGENKEEDDAGAEQFLFALISTYLAHSDEIDTFIRQAKSKWKIERMVSVDRDILRLACAEALFMPDIPIPVCINEAVELTHRFADERAAKYINGILGDLSEEASHFRRTGEFTFSTNGQAQDPEEKSEVR